MLHSELRFLKEAKMAAVERSVVCTICRTPGFLLNCKSCPFVVHPRCAGMFSGFNPRAWYCEVCQQLLLPEDEKKAPEEMQKNEAAGDVEAAKEDKKVEIGGKGKEKEMLDDDAGSESGKDGEDSESDSDQDLGSESEDEPESQHGGGSKSTRKVTVEARCNGWTS
jgi:hypothetical protein